MARTPSSSSNGAHTSAEATPNAPSLPVSYDSISYDPIVDGLADIAITSDMEKMRVEADGRKLLQKVWLWKGSIEGFTDSAKKTTSSSLTTNRSYNALEDGPDVGGLPERLPTGEELLPHPAAVEYLEVGLIIGDEPQRFKARGLSQNKERAQEKLARGVADRDRSAMRVFILVTPDVALQSKYYVGVKPTSGRCFPRTIHGELIYFYAEFWDGMPDRTTKKARLHFLNARTKSLATVSKAAADRSSTSSTQDVVERWTTPKSLIVKLDLKSGLHAANNAGRASHDFDNVLRDESAQQLARELKVATPIMPELDFGVKLWKDWPHAIHTYIRVAILEHAGIKDLMRKLGLFRVTGSHLAPGTQFSMRPRIAGLLRSFKN